jgi:hypothetical protein
MQLAADPELRTAAIRVAHWYHRIPSTAFWAASVLDNTLSQLRYYQRTEVLTDASFVGLVHSQIQQILTDQEKLAALGRKSDAPDAPEYALYHNEIAHINNTFLFVAPGIRIALATHDHPHVLITSDRRFTDYTQRSFDRLRMRATLLSNSAEAERTVFFQKLNRKLVGVG